MALETVVFPQDPFSYGFSSRDYLYHDYALESQPREQEKVLPGIMNNSNNIEQSVDIANWDSSSTSALQWDSHSSPEPCITPRRKRRRTKSTKKKEEIEKQRMTHIAVERNRRKQMNEYLAVLRSLMPSSYVQRGDQASIIGGAINFVKELEQLLQSMEAQTKYSNQPQQINNNNNNTRRAVEQKEWAVADIEVTVVDSHANLKILSNKKPGLLMKLVVGLQSLRLSILHLNVTTLQHLVLYSLSLKVEEGSELKTVDEIATAVNQLLRVAQQQLPFLSTHHFKTSN